MPVSAAGPRILVLGGTSEIALAIVSELARGGPCQVVLAGRSPERLAAAGDSLTRAGVGEVSTLALDADDTDGHEAAIAAAFERLGGADVVLLAVGKLGRRGGVPSDVRDAVDVLRVNVVGAGSLLICAARALQAQGNGTLVVLSSVAGERARARNAVYGAAKAGLDALAQALGDALHGDGVRVMVVRPGFVRTQMTAGLAPAPFAIDPAAVARAVARGLERGEAIVWAPASLRWAMALVRLLPRAVFRRMPL